MRKHEAYANLQILAGLTEGEDQVESEDEVQSQNIRLEDDNPKQKKCCRISYWPRVHQWDGSELFLTWRGSCNWTLSSKGWLTS